MAYQHKKDRCMKDTKEIVENILRMKASEYDLTDSSEIVTSSKAMQIIHSGSAETNILPSETEEMMERCSEDEAMIDGECVSLENLESYNPGQEIGIEASELKEGIEKKRKRRNYIEFRKDYEET